MSPPLAVQPGTQWPPLVINVLLCPGFQAHAPVIDFPEIAVDQLLTSKKAFHILSACRYRCLVWHY